MSKRTRNREQTTKKSTNRNLLFIGLIVLAAVAVVSILIIISQSGGKAAAAARPNADGTSMGDPNAAVKVEEYSDFQCPYCGGFSKNVEPKIVEKYISTGKVHFTYIPYSFIGAELRAAEAAYCAADQNKFWQYHDVLFNDQGGENTGTFADDRLIVLAQQAGLKMTDFRPCFDNGKYTQKVKDDFAQGQQRGVTGTPYFFVNGKGPIDQNSLESSIEQALAGN